MTDAVSPCAHCAISCGLAGCASQARPTARADTAARWYVRYLLASGAASLATATVLGLVDGSVLATAISMPVWLAVLVGLSVWSGRRPRGEHRGGHRGEHRGDRLPTAVFAGWAAAWAATVGLGTTVFPGVLAWWVAGGAVMAAAACVGAYATHRRRRT